jgi:hypothetical protein
VEAEIRKFFRHFTDSYLDGLLLFEVRQPKVLRLTAMPSSKTVSVEGIMAQTRATFSSKAYIPRLIHTSVRRRETNVY